MHHSNLTRALVRRHIQDTDRVFIADDHLYSPKTGDHQTMWPSIRSAIGSRGAWYSSLRAKCRGNRDYILYLIGDVKALTCPAVEDRLRAATDVGSAMGTKPSQRASPALGATKMSRRA